MSLFKTLVLVTAIVGRFLTYLLMYFKMFPAPQPLTGD